MGRRLPEGTIPLFVLAVLLCLALFGSDAHAASETWDESGEVTRVKVFDKDDTLAITGADTVITIKIPSEHDPDGGSILAKGTVRLDGGTVTGDTLMVGSKTYFGDTPGYGGMTAVTLDRRGEAARLIFNKVVVNPGDGDFNLGAIKKTEGDSYKQGGIYVGSRDGWGGRDEALVTASFATTNSTDSDQFNTVVYVWGDVTLADGGTITLAGNAVGAGGIFGQRYDATGNASDGHGVFENAFAMAGGTLNMNSAYGAEIRMKDIDLSGGSVILTADKLYTDALSAAQDWKNAPALVAGAGRDGGSLAVRDSVLVTLGDYGTLRANKGSFIDVSGGAIVMDGSKNSEAILHADAAHDRARDAKDEAGVDISGGSITVAENKHGAIISRETNFSGGVIDVQGRLTVAGAAADAATVADGIAAADKKWGDFNFGGGTMNVGKNGVVDFVSGDVSLNAASGRIDGKLTIVNDGYAVSASDNGVYSTNLTVKSGGIGDVFTVNDLDLQITEKSSGNSGVTIDGVLVVGNAVTATEDVAKGSLNIRDGGSLSAGADNFISIKVLDPETGKVSVAPVNAAMAAALADSEGTLNLNAWNGKYLYNLTTSEYNALKSQLGVGDGELNLVGFIVGDKVRLAADNGKIDVAVTNPSAQVTIDANGAGSLVMGDRVSVQELILENGENIDSITLNKSGTFTGSGNPDSAIIKGGKNEAMNLEARDDVTLGIAGVGNIPQGGMLGDIVFVDGKAPRNLNVFDGKFKTGTIRADAIDAQVDMTVASSGEFGQKTSLQTDAVDFSNVLVGNHTAISVSDATLKVLGDVKLNGNAKSGVSLANGAAMTANSISGGSHLWVDGDSSLKVATDIVLNDGKYSDVRVLGGGTLAADRLDLGQGGGMVLVGDEDRKGTLIVREAALRGGMLFTDPAWGVGGVSINDATSVLFEKFADDKADGDIVIGRNSHFTYGTRNTDELITRVKEVATWGPGGTNPVTAAAALYRPMIIGNGQSLTLDGSLTAKDFGEGIRPATAGGTEYAPLANSAAFAADSLLIVNAHDLSATKAALTAESGTGTLTVDEGARLYIYNAKSSDEFKLLDGFTNYLGTGVIGDTAWNSADNINDSAMTRVVIRDDGSAVMATVTARNAKEVYAGAQDGTVNMLNDLYGYGSDGPGLNDVDSEDAGVRFISRATSDMYNRGGLTRQLATVEGAMQISVLGGTQLTALNIMRLNSDTIRKRFSFASGLIPHPEGHGFNRVKEVVEPEGAFGSMSYLDRLSAPGKRLIGVWAAPIYQHANVTAQKVGTFKNKYKSNLGGANIGFDFDLGDNLRFGLVGGIGGGKNKSREDGELARTSSSFDYMSINGYAAWSDCNFSILAEGGFNRIKSEVRQENWIDGKENRADVKTSAWDLGVTAEYLLTTGFGDIVPHFSLRYEGVGTNDHDIHTNGAAAFYVKSSAQHVLAMPVGVAFSKDFSGCGWRVTPYADLGALFAVGQKDYKSNVRTMTVPLTARTLRSRVVDSAAFNGHVGVNAERGRMFGGVNYNVVSSSNQTAHSLWANVGLSF